MTTVLLTGATGFIAGAVLAQGLASGVADRWLCLVRGTDLDRARLRLLGNLERFMGHEAARAAMSAVEVVLGDLADLDRQDDGCLQAVTHVLHLAADTSFRARANCHLVNVAGTRALARRARRMPRLVRFIYGGTAMICGRDAPALVRETDYPAEGADHLVAYTRSKVDAENLLRLEFPDLPLVIARPSIVMGHTRLGCGPSSSIFWMFRAGDRLRLIADDPNGHIDVVPVDWTADMLLGLLLKPSLSHDVYHLSAGLERRTNWQALGAAFQRCDPAGGARRYDRIAADDRLALRTRFARTFGLARPVDVAMLRAMRAYYEFGALGVAFANDRLVAEGLPLPPSLPDYLQVCLSVPSGLSIIDQFADDLGMFEPHRDPAEVAA